MGPYTVGSDLDDEFPDVHHYRTYDEALLANGADVRELTLEDWENLESDMQEADSMLTRSSRGNHSWGELLTAYDDVQEALARRGLSVS